MSYFVALVMLYASFMSTCLFLECVTGAIGFISLSSHLVVDNPVSIGHNLHQHLFSPHLLTWFVNFRLIRKGYKKPLEKSDLWSLSTENQARYIVTKFQHHWEKEMTAYKTSKYILVIISFMSLSSCFEWMR